MTTLDQCSPDQWENLTGMWVENLHGTLGILRAISHSTGGVKARIMWPRAGGGTQTAFTPAAILTLRDDLPRAWNPDGTPVSDHITDLEEIADEYRDHCLANGDDNTVAWIDSKRGELDAD